MAQLQDLRPGEQANIWGEIVENNILAVNAELIKTTALAESATQPAEVDEKIAVALAGFEGGGGGLTIPAGAKATFIVTANSSGVYPSNLVRPAGAVWEFHGPNSPGALMNVEGDSWVQTAS